MTPPISNDWWLAAALTGASLPTAMAQSQPVATHGTAAQSGVVTTATAGAPTTSAPLYIESAAGQKISTGPNEVKHVLFSDQSALTVGPNSQIVITSFRFDKQTQDGNLLVDMTKGLLRVVGGFLSKRRETVVRTSTATIGIRGGIGIIDSTPNRTDATFLFGQSMRFTSNEGSTGNITRPGFGSTISNDGISEPERTPTSKLNVLLGQLEKRPGGGNPNPNPSPAPAGQLMSTGNTPGGANNPSSNLANDRLKNAVDNNESKNPSNTLRNILAAGQTPNQS